MKADGAFRGIDGTALCHPERSEGSAEGLLTVSARLIEQSRGIGQVVA
jgi:hypothetical protein